MTWRVVSVRQRTDRAMQGCVIAEDGTGDARLLFSATDEPLPLPPAAQLLARQHHLTDPFTIARAAFPNVENEFQVHGDEHGSLDAALDEARRQIAEASDWREPDPRIPDQLRAAIGGLPDDVRMLREHVLQAFDQLAERVDSLQSRLSREIVLPGPASDDASEQGDPKAVLRQFLEQHPPTASEDSSVTEQDTQGSRRVDRKSASRSGREGREQPSDIKELGLGARIERALRERGLTSSTELRELSKKELLAIPGIGDKAVVDIGIALRSVAAKKSKPPRAKPRNTSKPVATRSPKMGKQSGQVIRFQDGWGFILNADGHRFFVHKSEIRTSGMPTLADGQAVTFVGIPHERGPRATEVWPD